MISGKQPGTPAPPGPGPPVKPARAKQTCGCCRQKGVTDPLSRVFPSMMFASLLQEAESWTQAALVLGQVISSVTWFLLPTAEEASAHPEGRSSWRLPGAPPWEAAQSPGVSEAAGPTQPPKPGCCAESPPQWALAAVKNSEIWGAQFQRASKKGGRRAGF